MNFWSNPDTTVKPLTAETLREGFEAMQRASERHLHERVERAREVRERGPYKSLLGRTIDDVYIRTGPIVCSKSMHDAIARALAEAEDAA